MYKATGHGKGVFCKKISEDDALQGALGNCFAIAAFGTWAGVKVGIILIIEPQFKIGYCWILGFGLKPLKTNSEFGDGIW